METHIYKKVKLKRTRTKLSNQSNLKRESSPTMSINKELLTFIEVDENSDNCSG